MLLKILEGSVEDVVDSICAAEFRFIATLKLEEGSVLNFAFQKNLKEIRQFSGEIASFQRAE